MKLKDQKIIFLNSYLPRAGHNFSSQAIKVFSDHKVLSQSHSETRLSRILASYYKIHDQLIYHNSEKDFMDRLFIKNLRENILKETNAPFIMIKDTSFIGVTELRRTFPNDIHLILIRDPKNVFNSLIKGMNLGEPSIKNQFKRLGNKTGIYPWFYSRKLSTQVLRETNDLSQHYIIRYEDLVLKNEELIFSLKEIFKTNKSLEQIKKELDEIKVINSSFFEEVGGKKIWEAKPKTREFDPIHRKANTWLIRKGIELGSKKLRKKFNYI